MRKISAVVSSFLLLVLITGTTCFAGILPDLKANPVVKAISIHCMLGKKTPEPLQQADGSWIFHYDRVSLTEYLDFGKALTQEGYSYSAPDPNVTDDWIVGAVVSDGTHQIAIDYNPYNGTTDVIYPEGLIVRQYDESNPFVVDRTMESALPEIPQTISLHGVTCKTILSEEYLEDIDGRKKNYSDVSYDLYSLFSTKLGEAGFTLESSETMIDGTTRAVVTDGQVTLTVDYNMDTQYASVIYPDGVFPRPAVQYDDYTVLQNGDQITVMEDVSMKVLGWHEVESFSHYYYDNGWIPAKHVSQSHVSAYGEHQVLVEFQIDYNRPDTKSVNNLLRNLRVHYAVYNPVSYNYGEMTSENNIYDDGDNEASGPKQFTFAVGFTLNDVEMEHPERVAVTFDSSDDLYRYVYFLK